MIGGEFQKIQSVPIAKGSVGAIAECRVATILTARPVATGEPEYSPEELKDFEPFAVELIDPGSWDDGDGVGLENASRELLRNRHRLTAGIDETGVDREMPNFGAFSALLVALADSLDKINALVWACSFSDEMKRSEVAASLYYLTFCTTSTEPSKYFIRALKDRSNPITRFVFRGFSTGLKECAVVTGERKSVFMGAASLLTRMLPDHISLLGPTCSVMHFEIQSELQNPIFPIEDSSACQVPLAFKPERPFGLSLRSGCTTSSSNRTPRTFLRSCSTLLADL